MSDQSFPFWYLKKALKKRLVCEGDPFKTFIIGDPLPPGKHGLWSRAGWKRGLFPDVLANYNLTQDRYMFNFSVSSWWLTICTALDISWHWQTHPRRGVASVWSLSAGYLDKNAIRDHSHSWRHHPRDREHNTGLHTHAKIITQIEGQVIDNCLKVRTSYLPNEILWGYRFEHSCVAYDQKAAKYVVSVNNLNKVNPLALHKVKASSCGIVMVLRYLWKVFQTPRIYGVNPSVSR